MASLFDTPVNVYQQQQDASSAFGDKHVLHNASAIDQIRSRIRADKASSGHRIGQAIANAGESMFGGGDVVVVPELRKANDMRNIQEKMSKSGFVYGTPEYFDMAASELAKAGYGDEALKAKQIGMTVQTQQQKINESAANVDLTKAKTSGQESANEIALVEAENADEFVQAKLEKLRGENNLNSAKIDSLIADAEATNKDLAIKQQNANTAAERARIADMQVKNNNAIEMFKASADKQYKEELININEGKNAIDMLKARALSNQTKPVTATMKKTVATLVDAKIKQSDDERLTDFDTAEEKEAFTSMVAIYANELMQVAGYNEAAAFEIAWQQLEPTISTESSWGDTEGGFDPAHAIVPDGVDPVVWSKLSKEQRQAILAAGN